MSRRPRSGVRSYTAAQKAEALELAARHGHAEAARRLGMPPETIRTWVNRAEAGTAVAKRDEAGVLLPWRERRERLLPKFGQVAATALDACQVAIDEGRARDAQSLMTVAAIAADKGQLLSGAATSRSESASVHVTATDRGELAEQVARMRAELGYSDVIDAEVIDGD